MMRKEFQAGVGYSVVALGGVRRFFAAAVPCRGGSLAEQTEDSLADASQKRLLQEEGGRGSIVMQSIFLKNIEDQRRLPADRRGFLREGTARNRLYSSAAVRRKPAGHRGLGHWIERMARSKSSGRATAWLLPGMTACRWAHLADVPFRDGGGPRL